MDLQSSINSYGKVLAEADKARKAEEAKELELRKKDIYSAAAQKEMTEQLRADYRDVRAKYKVRAHNLFDEIAAEIERRHADVDLADNKLLTALKVIEVSGKDNWQLHDSIIRQFHGNQPALQVLKAAFDKAGIPTGIEKHIYDYEDKLRQAQVALERAFTGVEKHTFYGAAKAMQEIAQYEGYDLDVDALFPSGHVDEVTMLMGLPRNWEDLAKK